MTTPRTPEVPSSSSPSPSATTAPEAPSATSVTTSVTPSVPMSVTPSATIDRRRRRSEVPHLAMDFQLKAVAARLGLKAIVLADDMGSPLAYAGDPGLAGILAQASMWTEARANGVDWMTRRWIEVVEPSVRDSQIFSALIPRRGSTDYWRVLAIGQTPETTDAVHRAVDGIERIVKGFTRRAA